MKLSSCRELKKQVLKRAYLVLRQARSLRTYRLRRARAVPDRRVQAEQATPVAAIGVAPARGKDYKLAVRILKGQEQHEPFLLRGLERFEGEVDLVRGVRYKPRLTVRPGGSCGHYKISAGTLGGFVEDAEHYFMLSNNHVLANSNFCFGDDPILQPGPADITGDFQIIGRLDRWYPLSKERRDGVDAALARFSDIVDFFHPWDYAGIGRIRRAPVSNRYSVSRVVKQGRTTRVTQGRISAYELDGVSVDYGTPTDPAVVTFDDQIEIIGDPPDRAFSAPGDSGSFVIDRGTMAPYALLYGGGPDSQGIDRTLAHFMPDVLRVMKVRLVQ